MSGKDRAPWSVGALHTEPAGGETEREGPGSLFQQRLRHRAKPVICGENVVFCAHWVTSVPWDVLGGERHLRVHLREDAGHGAEEPDAEADAALQDGAGEGGVCRRRTPLR